MAEILVVDDEEPIRNILTRWLERAGHHVQQAESADAALLAMQTAPAAVVFADIQMPGHDGLWLTAELRKRYATTAVVLATSVSTVPPKISMQAGVLAYLVKPFGEARVMEALEEALRWHTEAAVSPPSVKSDDLQAWLSSLEA